MLLQNECGLSEAAQANAQSSWPDGFSPQQTARRVLSDALIEARPYQRRIVSTAVEMLSGSWQRRDGEILSAASSVLIESPTGSGKTVMGLAVAAAIQQATGCRIGWVAMRRNLLTQARSENERRGFGSGLSQ